MTSSLDDRDARYPRERVDTVGEGCNTNEKGDNDNIVNRRHSIAHINFRKAIYRSLSLPQENDENNYIPIRYIKYLIKFLFICLLIILIGSLIRLMWVFHGQK